MTAKTYRRAPVRVWGFEEVAGEQGAGLAAEEVSPGCARSFRRGWDAVLLEDLPDGGGGDRDSQGREFAMDAPVPPRGVLSGEAQDQGADGADGGRSSTPSRYAGRGMLLLEQVAVPSQDGFWTYKQQELAELARREVVEQAGKNRAVGLGEGGSADMALQNHELVSEREDLDVLVAVAHRQQAQEGEGVGRGEVGQAQQHDRS